MKRRTMCCVVVMLALFATAPGWAAPARLSSQVDQVFGWLGAIWSAIWEQGGICIDPDGECGRPATQGAAPNAQGTAKEGEITPQGSGCIDPNGRPTECGPVPQGGCTIDPDGTPRCPAGT